MNNQVEKNKEKKYKLITLGGITLLILFSLLGWGSRSALGLAVIEVIILCLFLLFITGLVEKKVKLPFSLKLFIFLSFLSVIFSVYRHDSIVGFVKIFLFIIAFWIIAQITKTIKQLNFFAITLATTALAASAYGIINFFQLHDITLGVASFFGWRNIFGGFILFFLPLILTLYLTTVKKWEKYFFGLTSILLAINLYFTFSQASWLSFLITFLAIIWFLRKLPKKQLGIRLAVFLLIVILLVISLPKLHTIFVPTGTEANLKEASAVQTFAIQNRLDYWKTALEIFKHYPILGVGFDNFKTLYSHYQPNIWSWSVSPHNFVLLLLTEVGVLGLIAFSLFLFSLFKKGLTIIKTTTKTNNELIFPFALGLSASLGASFLHNLFDLDWEVPALLLIFFVEAGLLYALKRMVNKEKLDIQEEDNRPLKPKSSLKPFFGFLTFAILGYLVIVPALTDLWNKQVDKLQEDLPYKEEGFSIIKKALKLNPLNANLYQNLSESYQLKILDHQGNREENQYLSVKYAKKAVALDFQNSERRQSLGYALNFVSSGKDQEIIDAEKELKTAIEYNPNNNPYYYQLLGYILYRQEKYEEALEVLNIPLKLFNEESVKKIFADQPRLEIIENLLTKVRNLKELVEKDMKSR